MPSASPILPAHLSLTISIYSPQLLTQSSTSAVTDVNPTTTTSPATTVFPTDMDPSQMSSVLSLLSQYPPSFSPTNALTMTWSASIPGLNPIQPSTTAKTPSTNSTSTNTSSTSKTSSTGGIPTAYTAVMPAIFGAVIFIACIAVLRHYRRGSRRTKTDDPSLISRAWAGLSTISPSSSHRTLGPEDSLSQRHHSPQRGRSRTREISEARRSSLLRKARERFIAKESTLVTKEVV